MTSFTPQRKRRQRLAALVVIGSLAVAGLSVGSLALFTDQIPSDGNTFNSGTIDLDLNGDTGDVVNALVTYSDMLPGASATKVLSFANVGTGALRYAISAAVTDATVLKNALTLGVRVPVAVTFTDAGDLVNLTGHGLTGNTAVVFASVTGTTGITAGTTYFVKPTGLSVDSFQITAAADDGSAITLSTDGSGTSCDGSHGTVLYATDTFTNAAAAVKIVGDPTAGPQAGDRSLAASGSEKLCLRAALPFGTGNTYQNLGPTTLSLTIDAEQTLFNP